MSRADLEAAAAAGVIAPDQVGPLDEFLVARQRPAQGAPATGEEDLRFIRNFHDVFLATGIVLLAVGLAIGVISIANNLVQNWDIGSQGFSPIAITAALCAVAGAVLWVLAEAFSRRRRLFLPSIALCVTIAGYAAAAGTLAWIAFLGATTVAPNIFDPQLGVSVRATLLIVSGAALLAVCAFYWRFRLPFALGFAGSLALLFWLALVFVIAPPQVLGLMPFILLIGGICLFAGGLWFDTRDPQRTSRLSDNGFWLHLAAAPMILNGALGLIARLFSLSEDRTGAFGMMSIGSPVFAAVTLVIVALLGFVSLLINRRALIVSALLTTGVAVGVLMDAVGLGAGALAAAVLITLGAGVLVLGASWHKLRRALLSRVKPDGPWAAVFPADAPE